MDRNDTTFSSKRELPEISAQRDTRNNRHIGVETVLHRHLIDVVTLEPWWVVSGSKEVGPIGGAEHAPSEMRELQVMDQFNTLLSSSRSVLLFLREPFWEGLTCGEVVDLHLVVKSDLHHGLSNPFSTTRQQGKDQFDFLKTWRSG